MITVDRISGRLQECTSDPPNLGSKKGTVVSRIALLKGAGLTSGTDHGGAIDLAVWSDSAICVFWEYGSDRSITGSLQ
jgi:hypothetical protein